MSTSENIANSVNSVLKGYYQQLIAGNKGIFLIYPVDERGQPIETLWADNLNGQPVFLNQNNGWHNVTEISISPKEVKEFKARLTEWRHSESGFYVEYPGAPKNYLDLQSRNFQY